MKNNNFDSIFGNQDKDYQELIESQANTEGSFGTQQNDHSKKPLAKRKLRQTNIGHRKIGKK